MFCRDLTYDVFTVWNNNVYFFWLSTKLHLRDFKEPWHWDESIPILRYGNIHQTYDKKCFFTTDRVFLSHFICVFFTEIGHKVYVLLISLSYTFSFFFFNSKCKQEGCLQSICYFSPDMMQCYTCTLMLTILIWPR